MTALQFNGNGTEYFKIWIVNILLTIITLGIYYPWAKVRNRRYFYGNTALDNASFEYHATGKQLFLSYVIAMVLLLIYVSVRQINPNISMILGLVLLLAFPWIIWRSIKFNLRMSSYRNVHFGFNGSLASSYATYLGYPVAMLVTFGLVIIAVVTIIEQDIAITTGLAQSIYDLYVGEQDIAMTTRLTGFVTMALILIALPAFFAMMKKLTSHYFINGTHFGQGQFSADLTFKPLFNIILKAILLGALLTIIAMLIMGTLFYFLVDIEGIAALGTHIQNKQQDAQSSPLFFVLIPSMYVLFIAVSVYVKVYVIARQRTYLLAEMMLADSTRFSSSLRANTLFGITITNLLLLTFTAGFAYPWTSIRSYRYLTESISVEAAEGFDGYISKQGSEDALGAEISEAFDIGDIAF